MRQLSPETDSVAVRMAKVGFGAGRLDSRLSFGQSVGPAQAIAARAAPNPRREHRHPHARDDRGWFANLPLVRPDEVCRGVPPHEQGKRETSHELRRVLQHLPPRALPDEPRSLYPAQPPRSARAQAQMAPPLVRVLARTSMCRLWRVRPDPSRI